MRAVASGGQKEKRNVPGMPINDGGDLDFIGADHDERIERGGNQTDGVRALGEKAQRESGTSSRRGERGTHKGIQDTGSGAMTIETLEDFKEASQSYGRGSEEVLGAYMLLDLTPHGRNEWSPGRYGRLGASARSV
jgi:hypothetical protein